MAMHSFQLIQAHKIEIDFISSKKFYCAIVLLRNRFYCSLPRPDTLKKLCSQSSRHLSLSRHGKHSRKVGERCGVRRKIERVQLPWLTNCILSHSRLGEHFTVHRFLENIALSASKPWLYGQEGFQEECRLCHITSFQSLTAVTEFKRFME